MSALAFLEFFCGGGMARHGLGPDWSCTFANDIDARKGAAYAANFGCKVLKVGDVAKLTAADLPGRADLAWASFPCQDLSEAGDRNGLAGFRSNVIWPCLRLVDALRAEGRPPRMIVLENVTGLLDRSQALFFDAIGDALTDMSYRFGALMIDAVLFVPQSRPRVFIIAVDKAISIPGSDRHTAGLTWAGPRLPFHTDAVVRAMHGRRDPIWWRLPVPPMRDVYLGDLIEEKPTGVPWHTPAETERIISMMAPIHLEKLDDAKGWGERAVGGLYRRTRGKGANKRSAWEVRFDDVAGCLRVPSGGSSRQSLLIVDGSSVRSRLLSPREAARLMGLPDTYRLPSNTNDALRPYGRRRGRTGGPLSGSAHPRATPEGAQSHHRAPNQALRRCRSARRRGIVAGDGAMKSLKAQLDELTDRQVVERCMELAGILWAYNELGSFEGRNPEINRIRREAKMLRHGDMRRARLIHAAIEATVTTWRGKPIEYDTYDYGDAEETNDEAKSPDTIRPLLGGPSL
jgi:DNA (cytosine-5)-methyltransferase 1